MNPQYSATKLANERVINIVSQQLATPVVPPFSVWFVMLAPRLFRVHRDI
jgi:hypothetical protein